MMYLQRYLKHTVKQMLLAGIRDFYSPIRSMDNFLIFFNKWQKMANNPRLQFFFLATIFIKTNFTFLC